MIGRELLRPRFLFGQRLACVHVEEEVVQLLVVVLFVADRFDVAVFDFDETAVLNLEATHASICSGLPLTATPLLVKLTSLRSVEPDLTDLDLGNLVAFDRERRALILGLLQAVVLVRVRIALAKIDPRSQRVLYEPLDTCSFPIAKVDHDRAAVDFKNRLRLPHNRHRLPDVQRFKSIDFGLEVDDLAGFGVIEQFLQHEPI